MSFLPLLSSSAAPPLLVVGPSGLVIEEAPKINGSFGWEMESLPKKVVVFVVDASLRKSHVGITDPSSGGPSGRKVGAFGKGANVGVGGGGTRRAGVRGGGGRGGLELEVLVAAIRMGGLSTGTDEVAVVTPGGFGGRGGGREDLVVVAAAGFNGGWSDDGPKGTTGTPSWVLCTSATTTISGGEDLKRTFLK